MRKAALLLAAAIAAILVAAPAVGLPRVVPELPRVSRVGSTLSRTARHAGRVPAALRGGCPWCRSPPTPNGARKITTVEPGQGSCSGLLLPPEEASASTWTGALRQLLGRPRAADPVSGRPGRPQPISSRRDLGELPRCETGRWELVIPRPTVSRSNTPMGASPRSPSCGSRRRSTPACTSIDSARASRARA